MNWLEHAFYLSVGGFLGLVAGLILDGRESPKAGRGNIHKRIPLPTEFVPPVRFNWGGFEKRLDPEPAPQSEISDTLHALNVKIWDLQLAVDTAVRLHRPRARIKEQLAEAIRLRDQLMARAANPPT